MLRSLQANREHLNVIHNDRELREIERLKLDEWDLIDALVPILTEFDIVTIVHQTDKEGTLSRNHLNHNTSTLLNLKLHEYTQFLRRRPGRHVSVPSAAYRLANERRLVNTCHRHGRRLHWPPTRQLGEAIRLPL